jgi:hypothetical protein
VNKGNLIPWIRWISSKHKDTCPVRSHGMIHPFTWTCPQVGKFEPSLRCISHVNMVTIQHAKSLTRQVKGIQIIRKAFVPGGPTKDIHNIIDEDSSVTSTGRRNGPSASQLSPFSRRNVKRPSIITAMSVAKTTESTKIHNEGRERM